VPLPPASLLIVEDHKDWREFYVRAAQAEGIEIIRIADVLADAESYVEALKFSVAFIDIGLDEKNDQNADGMRVMEKIRALGDQTSIVVVTGRSGRDVLRIAKNVLREYDAYDILAKPDIKPSEIKDLITSGLAKFRERVSEEQATIGDALRGDEPRPYWDDETLRWSGVRDGVHGLYRFLDQLLSAYLPLVPREPSEPLSLDAEVGIAHQAYWSRAIGEAIVVLFGGQVAMADVLGQRRAGEALLGRYAVGERLSDFSGNGVAGAIFALTDAPRGAFAESK